MSRRTVVTLVLTGVVLIVVAVGAFAWLNTAALRTMTANALRETTSRDVTVGAATLAPAWPPAIRVTDVRIGNASWAGEVSFAEIPRARATLDTGALLRGEVRLAALYAEGVAVNLARNAEGAWNLPSGEGGDTSTAIPVLTLRNARLRYASPAREEPLQLAFARFRSVRDDTGNRVRLTAGDGDAITAEVNHAVLQSLVRGAGATPLQFEARAGDNRVSFQGEVSPSGPAASGQVDLEVPDPERFARAYPIVPPGLPATTLRTEVAHETGTWRFRALHSWVAGQPVTGTLTLAPEDGDRPKLSGKLTLPQWPVPLAAVCDGEAGGVLPQALLTALPPWLIELELTVEQLQCGDKPAGGLSANLRWSGGTLYYDILQAQFLTGELDVSGEITPAADGSPTITIDGNVHALDLAAVADLLGAGDTPLAGHIHGRADLTTTLDAGLGGATGRVALFMRDGVLPRRLVERAALDLGSLTVAEGPARVGLRCAAGEMTLENGQGALQVLMVRTPDALVVAEGSVDFAGRSLSLNIQADSDTVAFLDLSVPIRVSGPFSEPTVSVDTAAALVEGGAKALIGIVGAPLTALATFLGGAADPQSQCDLGRQGDG